MPGAKCVCCRLGVVIIKADEEDGEGDRSEEDDDNVVDESESTIPLFDDSTVTSLLNRGGLSSNGSPLVSHAELPPMPGLPGSFRGSLWRAPLPELWITEPPELGIFVGGDPHMSGPRSDVDHDILQAKNTK